MYYFQQYSKLQHGDEAIEVDLGNTTPKSKLTTMNVFPYLQVP